MKIFGYNDKDDALLSLREVTIQADRERIKSLAAFLNHAAELMEKNGDKFGHIHYRDYVKDLPKGADLIVSK